MFTLKMLILHFMLWAASQGYYGDVTQYHFVDIGAQPDYLEISFGSTNAIFDLGLDGSIYDHGLFFNSGHVVPKEEVNQNITRYINDNPVEAGKIYTYVLNN